MCTCLPYNVQRQNLFIKPLGSDKTPSGPPMVSCSSSLKRMQAKPSNPMHLQHRIRIMPKKCSIPCFFPSLPRLVISPPCHHPASCDFYSPALSFLLSSPERALVFLSFSRLLDVA